MLVEKLGGTISMQPVVEYPHNIETPDYTYNGFRYDLKTPEKNKKHTFTKIFITKKGKQTILL